MEAITSPSPPVVLGIPLTEIDKQLAQIPLRREQIIKQANDALAEQSRIVEECNRMLAQLDGAEFALQLLALPYRNGILNPERSESVVQEEMVG